MSSEETARSPIRSYRDLRVWQRGMDLVIASYQLSKKLPKVETYGLAFQIRRAAVSIPSNIAEGHGRKHLGDYLRHLSIANGSLKELETELLIAERLGYVSSGPIIAIAEEVGRMLATLINRLRQRKEA